MPKLNLVAVRYLAAAAIALVLVALLAVIGLSIARGVDSTAQVVGLVAFVGTLIGLLVSLLNGQQVATAVGDVQDKVNGHLAAHVGHTDDQVRAIVDQRLAGAQIQPTEVKPPDGT